MAKRAAPKTHDGFEIFESTVIVRGQTWFWRLRRRGRIVADGSEAYASKRNALRAVTAVAKWLGTGKVKVFVA